MTIIVKVSVFAMATILGLVGMAQDCIKEHRKYKIKIKKIENKGKNV